MSKKVIAAECFEVVMEEVSKEIEKILKILPESTMDRESLVAYLNTLEDMAEVVYAYLPKGERANVITLCATWMDIGILLGRSPQILTDILKRTGAKIEER